MKRNIRAVERANNCEELRMSRAVRVAREAERGLRPESLVNADKAAEGGVATPREEAAAWKIGMERRPRTVRHWWGRWPQVHNDWAGTFMCVEEAGR